MASKKEKKWTFVLKDIDPLDLESIYGISDILNNIYQEVCPENTTKITDIVINEKEQGIFSFLDESKKLHTCIVTMIDYISKDELQNNCKCFWDRNYFKTQPLGCPVNFISNKITKNYNSEITKEKYSISENLTKNKYENLQNKKDSKDPLSFETKEYYESDGIFCSFNCWLAYYEENKHNPLYNMSYIYMNKIYEKCFGEDINKIYPAPHWRLLKEYGGNLSIEEFRNSFNKILYTDTGDTIKNLSKFRPIGFVYEERIKF